MGVSSNGIPATCYVAARRPTEACEPYRTSADPVALFRREVLVKTKSRPLADEWIKGQSLKQVAFYCGGRHLVFTGISRRNITTHFGNLL